MGMTAVEKVLARASGCGSVRPGDIVYPDPDIVLIHDGLVMPAKADLDAVGIDRVFDPDRIYVVTDHDVVYTNPRAVERGTNIRRIVKEWGIKNFFDVGRGGQGHIFPIEAGIVNPGMFYFDNDRHCTNAGGIGAVAMRAGQEISTVLATGTLWTRVPKTIRLTLNGRLQPGVYARDLGFCLAAQLQDSGSYGISLDYRVLEFAGDLDQFSLGERVALCGSPTEIRAIGVFVPPSDDIVEAARKRARFPFEPVYSDADAEYEADIAMDISALEPQVVPTGGVHLSQDLSRFEGTAIDHAFIGSCGSGMYDDLVVAAQILRGRRIADDVRLFVVPGSEYSTKRMHQEGLFDVFHDAGAMIMPAGCGPCSGGKMAPVHSGEVSISTAMNNEAGRFGARDAELFLASPATVAASAIAGRIVDPRNVGALDAPEGATA